MTIENWKEEFIKKFTDEVNEENGYYDSQFTNIKPTEVIAFIESILAAQTTEFVEKLEDCFDDFKEPLPILIKHLIEELKASPSPSNH